MPAMRALADPASKLGGHCQLLLTSGALYLKRSGLRRSRRDRWGRRRRRERNVNAARAGSAGRRHRESLAAVNAIALFASEVIGHQQCLLAAGAFQLNRHEFTSSRGRVRAEAFSGRHVTVVANATSLKSGLRSDADSPSHLVYTAAALCKTGERVGEVRRLNSPRSLMCG